MTWTSTKSTLVLAVTLTAVLVAWPVPVLADDAPLPEFVGAGGCKICHKKAADGDQYGKWLTTGHAKAFETLGTPKAAEIAAAKGLEGSPQELDECLSCHVTAHGVEAERLGKKYKVEEGVGCESCHGAGGVYKKKAIMEDREKSLAAGMIIPTEETCTTCHNDKSPTFAGFDYEKMREKIIHPKPPAAEG